MKTWKKEANNCEKYGQGGNVNSLARELLSSLRGNQQSNDVTIKLSDGELGASKLILSARCEYFAKMFDGNNNFLEADGIVNMPQYKCKVMKRVLEYLYGGDVHFGDFSILEAVELLDLLRMLMLNDPYEALKDDITGILDEGFQCRDDEVKEYLGIINDIERYKIKEITDGILFVLRVYSDFIVSNCSEEIGCLSFDAFKVLMNYFTSNMGRFQLLKIWYEKNPEEHDKVKELKHFVILHKISAEDLMGKVRDSNLFTTNEILDTLFKKHMDMKRAVFKNNLRCIYHQQQADIENE